MDINESAAGIVTCTISTKVPPNTVAVILMVSQQGGSDAFYIYPDEGSKGTTLPHLEGAHVIAIKNQQLKFNLQTGGDDFDLYMFGYFIEGTVKSK